MDSGCRCWPWRADVTGAAPEGPDAPGAGPGAPDRPGAEARQLGPTPGRPRSPPCLRSGDAGCRGRPSPPAPRRGRGRPRVGRRAPSQAEAGPRSATMMRKPVSAAVTRSSTVVPEDNDARTAFVSSSDSTRSTASPPRFAPMSCWASQDATARRAGGMAAKSGTTVQPLADHPARACLRPAPACYPSREWPKPGSSAGLREGLHP